MKHVSEEGIRPRRGMTFLAIRSSCPRDLPEGKTPTPKDTRCGKDGGAGFTKNRTEWVGKRTQAIPLEESFFAETTNSAQKQGRPLSIVRLTRYRRVW